MKNIPFVDDLFRNIEHSAKIYLYFSSTSYGTDYDPYEDNKTKTNLNPKVIRGIVNQVSPEALVYKQYGLEKMGAVSVLTKRKYKTWFEECRRIVIDNADYEVFREGVGTKAIISDRPAQLIRVILTRKE